MVNAYFRWMMKLATPLRGSNEFTRVMEILYDIPFEYSLPMDGNRYEDGIDLRYRYGYEKHILDSQIASEIDTKPCSVLEMMLALSLRIEEDIMNDFTVGDRTGDWFVGMLSSLGIFIPDSEFQNSDEDYIRKAVERFMKRDYALDGRGGLFTIPGRRDMRDAEIWYQAMWYLTYKEETTDANGHKH